MVGIIRDNRPQVFLGMEKFPINLLYIFRTPFSKNNTSGQCWGMLENVVNHSSKKIFTNLKKVDIHCLKSVGIRSYSGPNARRCGPE